MRLHLLFALSLLAACRSPSSSVAPTSPSSPSSPLSISWAPKQETGGRHQLELVVEKRIATEKDLAVVLRVPDGARLDPSTPRWSIDAGKIGTLKYEVAVSWSGEVPATDLIAVVDMQGTGSGFHAEVPWRFGRAAQVEPPLKQTGQPVQLGGSNLGRPVDLTK